MCTEVLSGGLLGVNEFTPMASDLQKSYSIEEDQ